MSKSKCVIEPMNTDCISPELVANRLYEEVRDNKCTKILVFFGDEEGNNDFMQIGHKNNELLWIVQSFIHNLMDEAIDN